MIIQDVRCVLPINKLFKSLLLAVWVCIRESERSIDSYSVRQYIVVVFCNALSDLLKYCLSLLGTSTKV